VEPNTRKNRVVKAVGRLRVALLTALALLVTAPGVTSAREAGERADLGYYNLVDPEGRVILQTGLEVSRGDEFISEDNRKYRITLVEGDRAMVRDLGEVSLAPEYGSRSLATLLRAGLQRVSPAWWGSHRAAQAGRPKVAIYHSHSDESYLPSDGTASRPGKGGIFRVGSSLGESLERNGIDVVHDTTSHDPHDSASYDRSRRTALKLLQQERPAMILDVHRDTAPREAYERTVAGQPINQVMLVVGRENPQMNATLDFAKRVKKAADDRFPGLIRGIFFAQGRYNQDLSPRALLFEVGSHTNRREDAERGIALLGEVLPALMGPGTTAGRARESRAGWTTAAFILALAAGGAIAYLFLSTGSWREAREKLRRVAGREWADLLGGFRRKNPPEGGS